MNGMSNVQYDNPAEEFTAAQSAEPSRSNFMDMLVSRGIAKDSRQAQLILVGIVVVAIVVAFFAYRWGTRGNAAPSQRAVDEALRTVEYLRK